MSHSDIPGNCEYYGVCLNVITERPLFKRRKQAQEESIDALSKRVYGQFSIETLHERGKRN